MALAGSGRRRVLVSSIEHESVLKAVPDADIMPVDGDGVSISLPSSACSRPRTSPRWCR